MWWLIPIAIGAGLIIKKGFDFKTAYDNFSLSYKITNVRIRGTKFMFDLYTSVINPANAAITINKPNIRILYKDRELYNTGILKDVSILAQQTSQLPKVAVSIDMIANLTSFKDILKEILKSENFSILQIPTIISNNAEKVYALFDVAFVGYVANVAISYKENVKNLMSGLGYAPISARERKIKACPQCDKYFPQPKVGVYKRLVRKDGNVEDTVKEMIKLVNNHSSEVRNALHLVRGKDVMESSRKIFDFLYNHIKYNIERGEILNTPAASYYWGQVIARNNEHNTQSWPVDCDDFSIFAASFLKELGYPYAFRIASYDGINYSHVYCVVPLSGGKEIIIDPVYYEFNAEKEPVKQQTIKGY